jgi:NADH-quinone oxidoreductase subunit M
MILLWLIVWLAVGGVVAWVAGRINDSWPRWISLGVLAVGLGLVIAIWAHTPGLVQNAPDSPWLIQVDRPWIPQLGISLLLRMDGLSVLLVALVLFMGIMAVIASWTGIEERVGFFHFNLLWSVAALTGVFVALDLILFYIFYEIMLVPLYFMIGIWGHENRVYATLKFFLFTQLSGLLMLLAILGLYVVHGRVTGLYTFNYFELLGTPIAPGIAFWFMLGFFAAFAVKLSVVPVHTWLPDAHTQAPTAGSVILAGLVLKAGAYGMLRFVVPLFPEAALSFAPIAMLLGVIGIVYGAVLAFAQTDFKRLVAYTSVSHMGFVLLGVFSWNELAQQGAVMVMLSHGISTGALFVLVGLLQDRMHTRELSRMGGLWSVVPHMGNVVLVFALASLALPSMGNFVGEFLTLVGAYLANIPLVIVATVGFIFATVYALWMMQRIFGGANTEGWQIPDLRLREAIMMGLLIAVIFWMGLYPQPILNTAAPALATLREYVLETLPLQATAPSGEQVFATPSGSGTWIAHVRAGVTPALTDSHPPGVHLAAERVDVTPAPGWSPKAEEGRLP